LLLSLLFVVLIVARVVKTSRLVATTTTDSRHRNTVLTSYENVYVLVKGHCQRAKWTKVGGRKLSPQQPISTGQYGYIKCEWMCLDNAQCKGYTFKKAGNHSECALNLYAAAQLQPDQDTDYYELVKKYPDCRGNWFVAYLLTDLSTCVKKER